MDNPFARLSSSLVQSGVSPRYARRLVRELNDHYQQLDADHQEQGFVREAAQQLARDQMGDERIISTIVASDPSANAVARRFPPQFEAPAATSPSRPMTG